ncbi:MAG: dTDP-4-dehydrorhamnose reductase [Brucellaceae bacterium]|nr:dTDP-4-dehydrorhamnose reductase [Brucellaceae bacterium]
MRLLVTGTEGQVVRALTEQAGEAGIACMAIGRPRLDLAAGPAARDALDAAIADFGPTMLVNAAAYTAVDQAEDEPYLADAVNGEGAGMVAAAAAAAGLPVVQLSTDYVFDGTKAGPYLESDPVNPQGAYGRSKLAGEEAVRAANPHHVILRTAWVYSPFGKNFLKTMLNLAATRDELRVVADQIGNPTAAHDIAGAIIAVGRMLDADPGFDIWGTYHFAGPEPMSWADFAAMIFAQSAARGGPSAQVAPITTAGYPTKALRPANSQLDTSRFTATFGLHPAPVAQGIASAIARFSEGQGVGQQEKPAAGFADVDVRNRLVELLRPGFETRLDAKLKQGMAAAPAVERTLAEVRAGLDRQVAALRNTKPEQAAAIERVSPDVFDELAALGMRIAGVEAVVAAEGTQPPMAQPLVDSSDPVEDHPGHLAANDHGGRPDGNRTESVPAKGRGGALYSGIALGMMAGAGLMWLAGSAGLFGAAAQPGPGVIVIPDDRLAVMQEALKDWRKALEAAEKRFKENDFGKAAADDRWLPLQQVHRDLFDAVPVKSRAGVSMILRRGKNGGYKMLVQGPLCNIVKATEPSMVDPVRDRPYLELCWQFGVWDETGAKF